jgi:hypothetical protein
MQAAEAGSGMGVKRRARRPRAFRAWNQAGSTRFYRRWSLERRMESDSASGTLLIAMLGGPILLFGIGEWRRQKPEAV